jgi:hypothetical protein
MLHKLTLGRLAWLLIVCACVFSACAGDEGGGGGNGGGGEPCEIVATVPNFGAAVFTTPTTIDNTYFPLTPGVASVLRFVDGDEIETVVIEVTSNTPTVNGVTCVEVHAREFLDDLLIEDTFDWYAQDDAGNVWYFGEDSTEFEYDDNDVLVGTDTSGSWTAGLDIAATGANAIAGIAMPGTPTVGMTHYQEYYLTEAEDVAEVFALNVTVTLTDGRVFNNCLQTLDCNPLEEGSHEYKYYAPGIGLIREESVEDGDLTDLRATFVTGAGNVPDFGTATFSTPTVIDNTYFPLTAGDSYIYREVTEDGTETIIVDVTNQTQVINGVTCRVVRDRVYLEGLLIEDTIDWYAQDDAGNVWYMGEIVTNYQYDAGGALIGSDNDGSWEAGVSGALPGINMLAAPAVGDAYEQEYWVGQAEDVAEVLSVTATVNLTNGSQYTNCLQTVDWNPLDPTGLEYKFYAAGIGMVFEQHVDEPVTAELTGMTP